MDSLIETLRRDVTSRLKIRSPIAADTALFSSGLVDSLSVLELVGLAEEHAGTLIAPEDVTLENFDSLAKIAQLVERLRSGAGGT